ncbi:MAG: zf-HC2 domain-containing protein [Anaerolineales bacterium]|nr:zf-HC2 domain-containing protein [Anaerolineales bacterium]
MNELNQSASSQMAPTNMNQDHLVDLMQRLEYTMENAYSCEEAFALLDEYVELVASHEEARRLMPLVQNHLDMCPDCRDEFEILLHVLKTADSDE